MHPNVREELQWLVLEVEEEIFHIYRQVLPSVAPEASHPLGPASTLAQPIMGALRDAGIGDAVIQTFKQAMEDFQKGEAWAQQAMAATDPQRPFATWSIERLGRAHRRLMEVSVFVAVRQAWFESFRRPRDERGKPTHWL